MRSLQDALYNWLTIKVIADVRKDDQAATDTERLFFDMLKEDHEISEINVKKEDEMYIVTYIQKEEEKKTRFPIELIDIMLEQMQNEPDKYVNYPNEQ